MRGVASGTLACVLCPAALGLPHRPPAPEVGAPEKDRGIGGLGNLATAALILGLFLLGAAGPVPWWGDLRATAGSVGGSRVLKTGLEGIMPTCKGFRGILKDYTES